MEGEEDIQPSSSSLIRPNDGTGIRSNSSVSSEEIGSDISKEFAIKKIDILKRKLRKLENRSVDFDHEEREERLMIREENARTQLDALLKKFGQEKNLSSLTKKKDFSDLLTVKGTDSPVLDQMITEKLKRMHNVLDSDPLLYRDELINICKTAREKETGINKQSSIPLDAQAFEPFVCKVASHVNLILKRFRQACFTEAMDDYLDDEEQQAVNSQFAAEKPDEPASAARMEELSKQIKVLTPAEEIVPDGSSCHDCVSASNEEDNEDEYTEIVHESSVEAVIGNSNGNETITEHLDTEPVEDGIRPGATPPTVQDQEKESTAVPEHFKDNEAPNPGRVNIQAVNDVATPLRETPAVADASNANPDGELPSSSSVQCISFCEIVNELRVADVAADGDVRVSSVSQKRNVLADDDEDIQFVCEMEKPYVEPINSEKDHYVRNWLENNCSLNPDPIVEEPASKRARYDVIDLDAPGDGTLERCTPYVSPPDVIILD